MFEAAERIADAVLYEGYVLYPYRASAIKNRLRWQFGIVAPRSPRDDGEPWFAQTDCVADIRRATLLGSPVVHVRVRALRPARSEAGWLDAPSHSIDLEPIDLGALPATRNVRLEEFGIDARLTVAGLRAGERFIKLRLRLENLEPWRADFSNDRDAMLAHSLVGAHLLLAIDGGAFVSLLDPPVEATAVVAACQNQHVWPVLVGDRSTCSLMLASPIVLYDFPAIAKESRGDLCDGAEIDEILSLRILTMTDEEKAEARATDPRARDIVERVEALTPAAFDALHGTMRSADFFNPPGSPSPEDASVVVRGAAVARGSRVRLRPNRRADSMDMFLAGQAATVAGVYRDVDDRVYVAVTVDADPAAALHESFGRYFYFDPSEIDLNDGN